MCKFKSRTSKLAVLAVGVLLAFTLSLVFAINNGISAFAAEADALVSSETKVYSKVSIDDDFDDSSVLVVMDKRIGGIN